MVTTQALRHYAHMALDLAASIDADVEQHDDDDDRAVADLVDGLQRHGLDLLGVAARRDLVDRTLADQVVYAADEWAALEVTR